MQLITPVYQLNMRLKATDKINGTPLFLIGYEMHAEQDQRKHVNAVEPHQVA